MHIHLPPWVKIPIYIYFGIWAWILLGALADDLHFLPVWLDWGAAYIIGPWLIFGIPLLLITIGIAYVISRIFDSIEAKYGHEGRNKARSFILGAIVYVVLFRLFSRDIFGFYGGSIAEALLNFHKSYTYTARLATMILTHALPFLLLYPAYFIGKKRFRYINSKFLMGTLLGILIVILMNTCFWLSFLDSVIPAISLIC